MACCSSVDNCFCTPALQKPFELGADLVIHSATKYLDGQGRCVGGAVLGNEQLVGKDVFGFLRSAGPSMSPFNAWVFLKGLETLELRMRAHSQSALQLARWLKCSRAFAKCITPGSESHPQHALAKRQQSGFGGIIAFEVERGREGAWAFVDATRLMSITANLGDTKSTITHPATPRIRASRRRSGSAPASPKGCCESRSAWRTCAICKPIWSVACRRGRGSMMSGELSAFAGSVSISTTRSGT